MLKFFKRPYVCGIIYSIILILFSTYVLLDTFVIERGEKITINNSKSTEIPINAVISENSYSDDNISINIKTITEYNTEIYIADVQVSNIEYLKTAFANNTYGRNIKQKTSEMAQNNNAILAINGDYYGFRNYGFVLRNGVIYRTSARTGTSNDDLVINSDGTFKIVNENTTDINKLLNDGAIQVLSFGPALINNGSVCISENTEVEQSKTSNPRTAIGIIDELHYVFVVSDGRTSESQGLSLYELANIMKTMGCKVAYNLDGGGSSTMWFNGNIINNPTDGNKSGERNVSDIVYIGY